MADPNPLFRMPIQRHGMFIWHSTHDQHMQAMSNHGQTLERLKERGGMSWCEMRAIVRCAKWQKMDESAAKAECLTIGQFEPFQRA